MIDIRLPVPLGSLEQLVSRRSLAVQMCSEQERFRSRLEVVKFKARAKLMSFKKIDWPSEKINIRFEDGVSPKALVPCRRWPSSNTELLTPLLAMTYNGEFVGQSYYSLGANFADVQLEFAEDGADVSFLRTSLMRISLIKLENYTCGSNLRVRIEVSSSEEFAFLKPFGFERLGSIALLNVEKSISRRRVEIKNTLSTYLRIAPQVGRGFVLDASKLDSCSVEDLNNEYAEVAWGLTNWARHSTLSEDESELIQALPSFSNVVEIGAGSGRVTKALIEKFKALTVTDVVPNVMNPISGMGGSATLVYDDIVNSQLQTSNFDLTMFWENGLGAIIDQRKRLSVVRNMARITKPGGLVMIAVRQLLPISVDQLMIAAQTSHVMGIYHTFAEEEMKEFCGRSLTIESVLVGGERPAGGRQMFYMYRKSSRA